MAAPRPRADHRLSSHDVRQLERSDQRRRQRQRADSERSIHGNRDRTGREPPTEGRKLVEMSWDPITRIVGSLGIYTKIDFANRQVAECHSTSSIFRGYSIFMKGKDPRDAHFITSRICGICGDNHATCAVYAQNMAFGVQPPRHGRVDHQPRRGRRVHVRPQHLPGQPGRRRLLRADGQGDQPRASGTRPSAPPAPHANLHGYRTIADIMRSLNPFTGEFYREALQMSRLTREMFCLMEGRHVHPSTLYPGGVGTVPTHAALHRLPRPADEVRRVHEEGACRCTTTCSTSSTRRCPATRRSASAASCWAAGARSTIPTSATTPTRT